MTIASPNQAAAPAKSKLGMKVAQLSIADMNLTPQSASAPRSTVSSDKQTPPNRTAPGISVHLSIDLCGTQINVLDV
jgi:hypothetical protein